LSLVQEFDAFMEQKVKLMADREFDFKHWMYHPMEWTLQNAATYPLLTPSLLDLQLKSCTSFASERYFSTMHWILNLRRLSLSTKNLAAQALLNTNIQLALDLTFGEEGVFRLSRGVETWDEVEAELRRRNSLSRDGKDLERDDWGRPCATAGSRSRLRAWRYGRRDGMSRLGAAVSEATRVCWTGRFRLLPRPNSWRRECTARA
jgi:hypothetical protein